MSTTAPANPKTDPPWPDGLIKLGELITLGEAANLVREWTRATTSPTTVWRWTRRGRHGQILPHARIGRIVMTTAAAIEWFVAESTAVTVVQITKPKNTVCPAHRAAELAAEGFD